MSNEMNKELVSQQLNSVLFSMALEAIKQGNLDKLGVLTRVYLALAESLAESDLDLVRD